MLNLLLVIKQFMSVAYEMVECNNYCPVFFAASGQPISVCPPSY